MTQSVIRLVKNKIKDLLHLEMLPFWKKLKKKHHIFVRTNPLLYEVIVDQSKELNELEL